MHGFLLQVESRCQVRPALPAPEGGALPLPAAVDPKLLSFQPGSVEELNSVVEEGLPRLETPRGDSRVRAVTLDLVHMRDA